MSFSASMTLVDRSLRALLSVLLAATVLAACSDSPESSGEAGSNESALEFVGSDACAECHQDIYDRWSETLMANVLQDPQDDPGVILGDFATRDPLVTFDTTDVAFTYGSRWKQRYFTRIGDDYS